MWHEQRSWFQVPASSAEGLAHQLTEMTWTGCQAFTLSRYILANDATSADGAQEYGVFLPDPGSASRLIQIESITFSWFSEECALEYLNRMLRGEFDGGVLDHVERSRIQTPDRHGFCSLCR